MPAGVGGGLTAEAHLLASGPPPARSGALCPNYCAMFCTHCHVHLARHPGNAQRAHPRYHRPPLPALPCRSPPLQLFLELQLQHPDWLQMMLLDTECEVPAESQAWAVDLLGWALEAAGARCARPLAGAVQAALAEGARTAGEPPGSTASRLAGGGIAATTAVSSLGSSGLPPLAGAVLGLVERAVALVRGCARRAAAATASASAGMHPEHPDVPTEACALLVRYAALGSWAAAHLMQVCCIALRVACARFRLPVYRPACLHPSSTPHTFCYPKTCCWLAPTHPHPHTHTDA